MPIFRALCAAIASVFLSGCGDDIEYAEYSFAPVVLAIGESELRVRFTPQVQLDENGHAVGAIFGPDQEITFEVIAPIWGEPDDSFPATAADVSVQDVSITGEAGDWSAAIDYQWLADSMRTFSEETRAQTKDKRHAAFAWTTNSMAMQWTKATMTLTLVVVDAADNETSFELAAPLVPTFVDQQEEAEPVSVVDRLLMIIGIDRRPKTVPAY